MAKNKTQICSASYFLLVAHENYESHGKPYICTRV